MRNVIAAINVTLEEFCDHTAISADEELQLHNTGLPGKPVAEKAPEIGPQPDTDISVGNRSFIIQLMKLNLIDEYQL